MAEFMRTNDRIGWRKRCRCGAGLVALLLSSVLQLSAEPPSIVRQPGSQIVLDGKEATFNIEVSGSTPFQLQWKANGTNMPGATNTSLTVLASARPIPFSGPVKFHVAVTNGEGGLVSSAASLTPFTYRVETNGIVEFFVYGFEWSSYGLEASGTLNESNAWSTLASRRVPININTASAEWLMTIPDIDSILAQAIIETRNGPDGISGTEDDLPFRYVADLAYVPGMTPGLLQVLYLSCSVSCRPALFQDPPPRPGQTNVVLQPARFYRLRLLEESFP